MPATNRAQSRAHVPSSAALLLSLSRALDAPNGPLGRRARHLAARLARFPADRALQRRAGDLVAVLLAATDAGMALDDDAVIDDAFDSFLF